MGAIEVRKQGNETRRTVPVTLDGTQRRVLKVRRPLLTGGGAL